MDDNAPELELVPTLTSREKGRFVNFYCKRIRPHTNKEKEGVMKLIDNALRKGMTPEQIQIALENYEQSVQGLDVRLRKHIRSFFSADSLRMLAETAGAAVTEKGWVPSAGRRTRYSRQTRFATMTATMPTLASCSQCRRAHRQDSKRRAADHASLPNLGTAARTAVR